jgi:two-component system, LuxR family, sensor kinase FixL
MANEPRDFSSLDIKALIDALPDALLVVNERGLVEMINHAFERMFDYPAREFQGRTIRELFPSTKCETHSEAMVNVPEREVEARKKDGTAFPALLTCQSIVNTQPPRFICSIRPVAYAPNIDVRLLHVSRLATMGEMAAGIAHELNQPLTAIANYAQAGKWMLESKPPELLELGGALQEITTQALRAGSIIKRLRNLIQKGDTKREPVMMDELINEIKALMITDARLNRVQISLELQPDLPPVNVDRLQIQQVLLNLVRNAIDALKNLARETREVKIKSALRREDGKIEVCIIDNGPGVPSEMRDRMFLPFCSGEQGGVGLGLAISRTIVEAHDGALGYRSNDSRGACFFFSLPAAKAGEA